MFLLRSVRLCAGAEPGTVYIYLNVPPTCGNVKEVVLKSLVDSLSGGFQPYKFQAGDSPSKPSLEITVSATDGGQLRAAGTISTLIGEQTLEAQTFSYVCADLGSNLTRAFLKNAPWWLELKQQLRDVAIASGLDVNRPPVNAALHTDARLKLYFSNSFRLKAPRDNQTIKLIGYTCNGKYQIIANPANPAAGQLLVDSRGDLAEALVYFADEPTRSFFEPTCGAQSLADVKQKKPRLAGQ